MSPCPWPGKARHASKRAAYSAIAALGRTGKDPADLRPLRCGDHWHVTHGFRRSPKQIRKTIARSKRRSNR